MDVSAQRSNKYTPHIYTIPNHSGIIYLAPQSLKIEWVGVGAVDVKKELGKRRMDFCIICNVQ
jgi:hypothetical protein